MTLPSENFTPLEWVRSEDYPHLQIPLEGLGLARTINCMRLNLLFMQPTRNLIGRLAVESWCRSLELNNAIPGKDGSFHLLGLACDCVPRAVPTQRLLHLAMTGELARVGAEWDKLNFYSDKNYYHVALRLIEDGPSRMRIYRDWDLVS